MDELQTLIERADEIKAELQDTQAEIRFCEREIRTYEDLIAVENYQ